MKKSILSFSFIVTLMFSVTISNAQENELNYDKKSETMYVNGGAYAKIVKVKEGGLSLMKSFRVTSLSGEPLIFFKYSPITTTVGHEWVTTYKKGRARRVSQPVTETQNSYIVTFEKSGSSLRLNRGEGLAPRGLMKILVKNTLIKGNAVDPEAEEIYVSNYNGTKIKSAEVNIVLNGNEIMLNEKLIGKFTERVGKTDLGEDIIVISFYSIIGEKIAQAEVNSDNPVDWAVESMSDSKISSVLYEEPEAKENVVRWLVGKKYLQ